MHKPGQIYDEVYKINYYISYGVSWEDYIESINYQFEGKGIDPPPDEARGAARTDMYRVDGGDVIWIWSAEKNLAHLAHEVFHAVHFALDSRGTELSFDSDESFAYLIEMLTREILKKEPALRTVKVSKPVVKKPAKKGKVSRAIAKKAVKKVMQDRGV